MSVNIFYPDEILTFADAAKKNGTHPVESDLTIIKKPALVVESGIVQWVGPKKKTPKHLNAKKKVHEHNLLGHTILPAFVECHTHLVHAGSRSQEFEWRQSGVSYQEITARGGGIYSTVNATKKCSLENLVAIAQQKVNQFVKQGVTTLESKSGYGLDSKTELKMLTAIKRLKGPRIISTFLGAHAIPKNFANEVDYLSYLDTKVVPVIIKKQLAKRADIFIEKGFFTSESSKFFLKKWQSLGFDLTIHADQLTLSGGSDLAAELGAVSADHVIQIGDAEIKKLLKANTVATLLPTADLYMKCSYPPARKMIEAGLRVALATDYNPGTAPSLDINLVGLLARLEMKMSLPEVLVAYTLNAAAALGLSATVGSLEAGKAADFICTEGSWTELFYSPGSYRVNWSFMNGKNIYKKKY